MDALFIIALILAALIVLSLFDLFCKGLYSLLPKAIQSTLGRVLVIVDKVVVVSAFIVLPYIFGRFGYSLSAGWAAGGALFGLILAFGLRKTVHDRRLVNICSSKADVANERSEQSNDDFVCEQFNRGLELWKKEDYHSAKKCFESALEKGWSWTLFEYLASCERFIGNSAAAIKVYGDAIAEAVSLNYVEKLSELYAARAGAKLCGDSPSFQSGTKNQDFSGAVADYTQALCLLSDGKDFERSNYLLKRALGYRGMGNNDNALADFDEVINNYSHRELVFIEALAYRGDLLATLERYDEAVLDLTLGYDIGRDSVIFNWLEVRALVFKRMKKFDDALKDFDEVIRDNPNNVDVLVQRADVKASLGDYHGSISDATRALEICDEGARGKILEARAAFFTFVDDYRSAIKDCDEAAKLLPKNVSILESRALWKSALGDYRGAVVDFSCALGLDPECKIEDWKGYILQAQEKIASECT